MHNQTHFWFAFTCILSSILLFSQFSVTEQLLLIPWAVIFSLIALFPNIFDKYFCLDRKTHTCTERCRHPVTHSPIAFFLMILILTVGTIDSFWYNFMVNAIILAYGSHLFLDIFSQEGIPLGFVPTLFTQDPTKNYVFNEATKPRMRLCLSTDSFSRDNRRTNRHINLGCKIIIIFLCVHLLLELKDTSIDLETIMNALHWMIATEKARVV